MATEAAVRDDLAAVYRLCDKMGLNEGAWLGRVVELSRPDLIGLSKWLGHVGSSLLFFSEPIRGPERHSSTKNNLSLLWIVTTPSNVLR